MEFIKWFYGQFTAFTPQQERRLATSLQKRSPVVVELAASSCGPYLPWTPEAHAAAACYGDLTLLSWLLHESRYHGAKEVDIFCDPVRMLLLVHGYGWTLSGDPEHQKHSKLASISSRTSEQHKQQHLAFYGAAQRHRLQPCSFTPASLGSLPDILLKKIAFFYFSWTFPC